MGKAHDSHAMQGRGNDGVVASNSFIAFITCVYPLKNSGERQLVGRTTKAKFGPSKRFKSNNFAREEPELARHCPCPAYHTIKHIINYY